MKYQEIKRLKVTLLVDDQKSGEVSKLPSPTDSSREIPPLRIFLRLGSHNFHILMKKAGASSVSSSSDFQKRS